MPQQAITVADSDFNQTNTFWKNLIGCPGMIVDTEADGTVTASIDTSNALPEGKTAAGCTVVQGVNPGRFVLDGARTQALADRLGLGDVHVKLEPGENPHPWWPPIAVLMTLGAVTLVIWALRIVVHR